MKMYAKEFDSPWGGGRILKVRGRNPETGNLIGSSPIFLYSGDASSRRAAIREAARGILRFARRENTERAIAVATFGSRFALGRALYDNWVRHRSRRQEWLRERREGKS